MLNDAAKQRSASFWSWQFWQRQLIYRTTSYKTTWKLRLLMVVLPLALLMVTRGWWVPVLGWSLVCKSEIPRTDLILIDNLDPNYLLFEKAAGLIRQHGIGLVLVPVNASGQDPEKPNLVSREFSEVMIRVARLDPAKLLPVREVEPITLSVATQVADYLKGTNVRTVLILTSGFKSKRIHLIFSKVLSEMGIEAYCLPVWGTRRPENWAASWHGIQEVFLQLGKLAYYRLWIL
jgi:hypothetical protein